MIDQFKKEFIKQLHFLMAQAGQVLSKREIVVLDEFVKQVKSNGLKLIREK